MNTKPIKFTPRGGEFAYAAPTLEVLEIAIERGFTLSRDPEEIENPDYDDDYSEDYF
ncbi:MAG: hypothetical protein K2K30_05315 [Alistipes sp.]|nr:hypothetical protein [Alistipes sp.]